MKKVSVIIPVYNAERTIVACIESLLKQTMSDIEYIFVNDCSTDQTKRILTLIEDRFPDKVKVVHLSRNVGAGGARNAGIDIAQGEYLGFVDADDVAAPVMFEHLYRKAKECDYDIVDCGFFYEAKDQAIVYTSDELTGKLDDQKRSELIVAGGYLWSKLFKKSFWSVQGLTFRENAILEDSEIIAKAMATANTIGNVKEVLYHYKDMDNSLSKMTNAKKYYDNCFAAMKALYDTLSPLENYVKIQEAVEYEMLQMYVYAIIALVKKGQGADGDRVDDMLGNNDVLEKLQRLADFRKQYISAGYDNKYVKNKMDDEEIRIMKQNDQSPEELLG